MKKFTDYKHPNMFCLLKPGFLKYEKDFDNILKTNGWETCKKKRKKLSKPTAQTLYCMLNEKPFYKDLCDYMASDDCICYACHKPKSQCKHNDAVKDMKDLKDELRDKYGKDDMRNFMHSSDSPENVNREIGLCME
jgi:nucleoside-diphosphate kinase